METTVSQNQSVNLGVTYTKQFIRQGIETEHNEVEDKENIKETLKNDSEDKIETVKKYECIGLLFRGVLENNVSIEALLFNNHNYKPFKTIPLKNDTENPIYMANDNKSLHLKKSTVDTKQLQVKQRMQFWDAMELQRNQKDGPFVYFGKHTLQLLITGDVATVTFSGAMVDYGIGIRDYASPTNGNSTAYPTLKAEVDLDSENSNQYIPTVALGLPCPPQWSDGDRSVKISLSNDDVRFFKEVRSNYYAISNKPRSPIIEPEPTFEDMLKSWSALK